MTTQGYEQFQTTPGGFVQVAVLGGDIHTIDCVEGLTVGQALAQAEVTLETGQVVTLNGAPVLNMDETVEPDSVLAVVGRVKNG